MYKLGRTDALMKYGFYLPAALLGAGAQVGAPVAYAAHAYKTAPEEERSKRIIDAVGLTLAGVVGGRILGNLGGTVLHNALGLPPGEAFITAGMLKNVLGGAGAVLGGERYRHKYDAPAEKSETSE